MLRYQDVRDGKISLAEYRESLESDIEDDDDCEDYDPEDHEVYVSDSLILTKDNATKLEKYVIKTINEAAANNYEAVEYDEDDPDQSKWEYLQNCKSYCLDVQQGGCISGTVGDLIYHNQTREFVRKYEDDIGELVKRWIDGMGLEGCSFLVKDKEGNTDFTLKSFFDKLAWSSYEETARDLMVAAGFEEDF